MSLRARPSAGPDPSQGFPKSIRKNYSALVCGDGRVLGIIESVGRRVLREIDPASREGRRLLAGRKVTLHSATKHGESGALVASHRARTVESWPETGSRGRKLPDS